MKISKYAYGFIIIGVLFGGLIITKLIGVWDVSDRGAGYSKHSMQVEQYLS